MSFLSSSYVSRDQIGKPVANIRVYQAFKKADLNIEELRIFREAHCYPDLQIEGLTDYDVDSPFHWMGSKCKGQPPNATRLNIEVCFLPHPCPEYRARPWTRFGPKNWQYLDSICIGVKCG